MGSSAIDALEKEAVEQRNHLGKTTAELQAKLDFARDLFRVPAKVREHFGGIALVASALGLLLGYGAGGVARKD
ncbi:MAG TPA: hypothetical protein VMH85_08835 [Terriglobales bacterium]|nr:hypothetical protein [Terriglobales bacterium]